VIEELTTTYGEDVTVLLRSREQGQGPRIARLPRVRIIEARSLTPTLSPLRRCSRPAPWPCCAKMTWAISTRRCAPRRSTRDLRLVVAISTTGLGGGIRPFFRDCAVLSSSSMSAPSFGAAALGEPAPSHIRVAGRTLYVARRSDV